MLTFIRNIAQHVDKELALAASARRRNHAGIEFKHLEIAHVLGQESTYQHSKLHCLMLVWGLRQRRWREVLGQLFRIIGALSTTAIGLVPPVNNGGSNISLFAPHALSQEYSEIILRAKQDL
jgi:hypothetical protein